MKNTSITRRLKILKFIAHGKKLAVEHRINEREILGDNLLMLIIKHFAFVFIQLLNALSKNLIDSFFPRCGWSLLLGVPHVEPSIRCPHILAKMRFNAAG